MDVQITRDVVNLSGVARLCRCVGDGSIADSAMLKPIIDLSQMRLAMSPTSGDLSPRIYCGVCRTPNSIEARSCAQCGASLDLATATPTSTASLASLLREQSAGTAVTSDDAESPATTFGRWAKVYFWEVAALNLFQAVVYLVRSPGLLPYQGLLFISIVIAGLAVPLAVFGLLRYRRC